MVDMTKTVRGVDTDAYRAFRSKAVEAGISTGEALNQALRMWVNAQNRPRIVVRAEVEASEPPVAVASSVRPPEHHA